MIDIVAENLKELRKKKGLSQKSAAGEIGVGVKSLVDWEARRCLPPVCESLILLADYYGVSTDWLLGRDKHERIL